VARLIEKPDQVLALGRIDRGLAADGGINLAQEGGGNLRKGDAALQDAGRESGKVAHDAAPQRDDQSFAVHFQVQQFAAEFLEPRETLAAFARRHDDRLGIDASLLQHRQQRLQVKLRDMTVGHDRHDALCKGLQQFAGARQQAGPDMDVVGTRPKSHGNRFAHGASHSPFRASSATILSTSSPCGMSMDSSTMSA
jgi:hypothetical protein